MALKALKISVIALGLCSPILSVAQTIDSCLSANVDRYLWVTDSFGAVEGQDLQGRLMLAEKVFEQKKKPLSFLNGPWDKGLVSTPGAQRAALTDAIESLSSPNIKTLGDVKSFLQGQRKSGGSQRLNLLRAMAKGFSSAETTDSENRKKDNELFKARPISKILEETQDQDFLRDVKNGAGIVVVCAKMSVVDSIECSKAVSLVLRESRWSGANIVFPKIWLEAFQSRVFQEGLRNLALKQIERIETKSEGSLTSDATQAFLKAGADKSQAEDYTWKTLALYGNGGHNKGLRALLYDLTERDMITAVSLSIIGTAVTAIDFNQRLNGKSHYAFPQETVGSCLSPKPYHFWLNAFISRWLRKSGFSPNIAAMGSFTVSKLYHLNRQMNNAGRSIDKIFAKTANHPTNRVIKMDLTLNAAGALYGVGLIKRPLDFSAGMDALVAKTSGFQGLSVTEAAKVSENKLSSFNLWHEVFQPDFVFEYYKAR